MDEKTVDKRNRSLMRQCYVTANVCMTYIGNGCAIGIVAIMIPSLRAKDSHIHTTVDEESWIASILGLSQMVGNILVTAILDRVGRRKCHFIALIPLLMGWVLLTLANDVAGLIAARFLHGFGIGIYGFLGMIIIGEMTEPKHRGIFLTMVSLSLTLGVLLSHALGSYFHWQTSALICSFTTYTSLLMLFLTPETPPWLISKGRIKEAGDIFSWLRGNGETQETEFEKMVTAQNVARTPSAVGQHITISVKTRRYLNNVNETSRKPEFYKPLTIMILLYVMYQFAGVNVIFSFTTDIIEQVVGPKANSNLLMIILDAERLLCNILIVYLMKVIKRRTLLFSTGFSCVFSKYLIAAYVYMKQKDMFAYDGQLIPIALISFYMFTLTVGVSSVPLTLGGEIFPLEYRGLGSGISMMVLALNFFLAVKLFPILNSAIGLSVTYIVYASITTVTLSIAWFLLPETKDRTLQDIEDIFRGCSPGDVKSSKPLRGTNDKDDEENL